MQPSSAIGSPRGSEALERLLAYGDVHRVFDIGSGAGDQAQIMRDAGREVTTISLEPPADIIGEYGAVLVQGEPWDAVWACHVLEHQTNAGAFLRQAFRDLRDGGVLAVTVPPLKHEVVGGHVAMFNAGTLVYNLILAGFDCREARVSHCYASGPAHPPYNISVLVRKKAASLPPLRRDKGDIETLAPFFPVPAVHGMDGRFSIGW